MNKLKQNFQYHYLFLIIPLMIIPFIQTRLLLDVSLNIRFLALNIGLLGSTMFFIFCGKKVQVSINNFVILYLIYILFSFVGVVISQNPSDALFQFAMISNFGFLVFLFTLIFSRYTFKIKHITLIFNTLGFIVLCITFADYFKILSTTKISHQSIYGITATFSHKNILSEILFLMLPFSMYSLFSKSHWQKVLAGINCVGILFLIITLLTRAVWLSVAIGLFFTFLTFVLVSGKTKLRMLFRSKKTYLTIASLLIVIIGSIVIYSKTDSFETISKSSLKIFKTYDSSQHRIELWKRSIDIAKENPILGKGLGTWRVEVLKYGNRGLQSEDNITFYQRPHNDFLWILSEQGIFGLILFSSIFVLIFYYLIKLIKQSKSNNEMVFYYLMLFLIIGYIVFSMFSFPRERIEHNLVLGIVFGLILSHYNLLKGKRENSTTEEKYIKVGLVLMSVLLMFNMYVAASRFNSEFHLKKAFDARNARIWNGVIYEIDKSESTFYQMDPFSTPVIWYRGEANFELGNFEGAFKDYLKCVEINPYHIHVLNNLATCYELKGNHEKAIELYNNAIHISPNFEDALLNLTAVYFNTNKFDSAFFTINKVDSTSKNIKYIPYLEVILMKRIEQLNLKIKDKDLIDVLNQVKSNNKWMIDVFVKSKQNFITFDKQLYIDALYILKDVDKKIDIDKYNELKSKYIESNN